MPKLGQSYRWTKAQRKAASIRMKAAYAKKKSSNNLGQVKVPIAQTAAVQESKLQQAQYDAQRHGEFQFRRGLVTAIECILRELR